MGRVIHKRRETLKIDFCFYESCQSRRAKKSLFCKEHKEKANSICHVTGCLGERYIDTSVEPKRGVLSIFCAAHHQPKESHKVLSDPIEEPKIIAALRGGDSDPTPASSSPVKPDTGDGTASSASSWVIKPKEWVRLKNWEDDVNGQLFEVVKWCERGFWHLRGHDKNGKEKGFGSDEHYGFQEENIERAYPRKGEVWYAWWNEDDKDTISIRVDHESICGKNCEYMKGGRGPVNYGKGADPTSLPESPAENAIDEESSATPALKFKVGDWVRHSEGEHHKGELSQITSIERKTIGVYEIILSISPEAKSHMGKGMWHCHELSHLEKAYPKVDEWWKYEKCVGHYGNGATSYPTEPWKVVTSTGYEDNSYLKCGCMVPVNFGRGD